MMKRTLLMLLTLLTMSSSACAEETAPVTLFAINVGKADALLLNAGSHTYLIDTGTVESWGRLSCALEMLGVKHLSGVIITHTDKDHGGGAMTLSTSSIKVDGWYAPAYYSGVKESKHPAVLAAKLRGQQVIWLQAGNTLPLGDGRLTVIGPLSQSEKENCNSLVLVAEGGGGRMLLTGDMEYPEEIELMNAGCIPPCEVLKVGNHGEGDATSEALVRYVKPRVAVISTNTDEEPDTPDIGVLQRLLKFGAQIYQTQQAGAGVLVTLQGGVPEAQLMDYPAFPELPSGVTLEGRDPDDDHIQIRNDSAQPVDISGWYLRSDRGGEQFVMPEGTVLQPGQTLTVSTLSSDKAGDVIWPEKKVWHKSKEDAAFLFDVYGRQVDVLE